MNLTLDAIEMVAIEFAHRRHTGRAGPCLPQALRPKTVEAALAIQRAVSQKLAPIAGWKCGLPTEQGPVLAPIYRLHEPSSPLAVWLEAGEVWAEPEIAFQLLTDLPARPTPYRREELIATSRPHMALELLQQRFQSPQDISFIDKLADGLLNQSLWIGPPLPQAPHQFELKINSATLNYRAEVQHPAQDPYAPFEWLVEFLRNRGQGLSRGQYIITGSYAGVLHLPINQRLQLEFGPWAQASLSCVGR